MEDKRFDHISIPSLGEAFRSSVMSDYYENAKLLMKSSKFNQVPIEYFQDFSRFIINEDFKEIIEGIIRSKRDTCAGG